MIVGSGIVAGMLLQRTIDNQRKAAAKTDGHKNEECKDFFVTYSGVEVDMSEAAEHRIIIIKER